MYSMFMRRDLPMCWAFMPHAIRRMLDFIDKYDHETKKEPFFEQTSRMFATGDVRFGLWLLIDGVEVVGHLLAQPEPLHLDTGPWEYVLIHQAEVDRGIDARVLTRRVFDEVQEWAKALKTNRLYMMTHRDGALARRYGFQPYKMMMVRPL